MQSTLKNNNILVHIWDQNNLYKCVFLLPIVFDCACLVIVLIAMYCMVEDTHDGTVTVYNVNKYVKYGV